MPIKSSSVDQWRCSFFGQEPVKTPPTFCLVRIPSVAYYYHIPISGFSAGSSSRSTITPVDRRDARNMMRLKNLSLHLRASISDDIGQYMKPFLLLILEVFYNIMSITNAKSEFLYASALKTLRTCHFKASKDIITKFASQAFHVIRIKY